MRVVGDEGDDRLERRRPTERRAPVSRSHAAFTRRTRKRIRFPTKSVSSDFDWRCDATTSTATLFAADAQPRVLPAADASRAADDGVAALLLSMSHHAPMTTVGASSSTVRSVDEAFGERARAAVVAFCKRSEAADFAVVALLLAAVRLADADADADARALASGCVSSCAPRSAARRRRSPSALPKRSALPRHARVSRATRRDTSQRRCGAASILFDNSL